MKIILTAFISLLFFACKDKLTADTMEARIKKDFEKQTQFEVKEVQLIKTDDYKYTGFITIVKDNSQSSVDVTIDKENPQQFMYQVVQLSPTVAREMYQRKLDSFLKSESYKKPIRTRKKD